MSNNIFLYKNTTKKFKISNKTNSNFFSSDFSKNMKNKNKNKKWV